MLIQIYGQNCYYCGEFATCIDHIVPVSYGGKNDFDNLVLSCSLCNLIASDRVFEDVEYKRDYILQKRSRKHKTTRALCTNCLLPFDYRVLSPSLFLCAECYDDEYTDMTYSRRNAWDRWIDVLLDAGVPVEAHRAIRKYGFRTREQKLITLVQIAYYDEK